MDTQTQANAGEEDMIRQMFSRAANTIVEASSLRKEVQALAEQVGELTNVVNELRGQNEGLKTELENVRKERDEARQKLWQEEVSHAQTKTELETTTFAHHGVMSDLQAEQSKLKEMEQAKEFYEAEAMKFEEFLKRANAKLVKAQEAITSAKHTITDMSYTADNVVRDLDSVDFAEVKEMPAPKAEATPEATADTGEYADGKEYGYNDQMARYGWWNKQGRDEDGRFQTFRPVAG